MKKLLMIALLIAAIPAVAMGQRTTVTCEDCTHVLPVYYGEGGLIAETDADKVTYVATCEGTTHTDQIEANDDGMVSLLLRGKLACMGDDEDNMFRIGPVMDGGWYWITLDTNSAVGGLVSMDVLENETVDLADAGDGVKVMEGRGANPLTETATGRSGLLPNILPEPPMEALRPCGYNDNGSAAGANRFTVRNSGCALGDGGTKIRAQGAVDPYTGLPTDGTMVRRPLTRGTPTVVTVDLWGNGTGHFNPNGEPAALAHRAAGSTDPRLGHALQVLALTDTGRNEPEVTSGGFAATIGGIGTNPIGETAPTPEAPVTGGATFAVAENVGTLSVYADSRYCSPTAKPPVNESETFTIWAYVASTQENQVTPTIATGKGNRRAARTTVTVVCPSGSAAAHEGQELVPENPFPTDR
ncbi:MAG: hypothetical protein OXH70_01020 [Acidobacteria bacterium]|nr:hypothetical protein [Acidobacteriota bacterium]